MQRLFAEKEAMYMLTFMNVPVYIVVEHIYILSKVTCFYIQHSRSIEDARESGSSAEAYWKVTCLS